jgi:NADPH:quinone reductase-like Zn-dependent oxidoreductase
MKALVIHGAKDLRLETRDAEAPGPGQVAVALKAGGHLWVRPALLQSRWVWADQTS